VAVHGCETAGGSCAPPTGRVQVRLFKCAGESAACVPQIQTLAGPLSSSTRTIGGFGPSGVASVRFPSPGVGQWTLVAQAVPMDQFEPPGGGPFDEPGSLANNQARVVITEP
jgi:hypothetical protein